MKPHTSKEFGLTVFCPELEAFIAEDKDPTVRAPTVYIRDDRQRVRKGTTKGPQTTSYRDFLDTGVVTGPTGSRILDKAERQFVERVVDQIQIQLGLIDPYSLPYFHEVYQEPKPFFDPNAFVRVKKAAPPQVKLIIHTDGRTTELVLTEGEHFLIEVRK
jgi:hypothetical protein